VEEAEEEQLLYYGQQNVVVGHFELVEVVELQLNKSQKYICFEILYNLQHIMSDVWFECNQGYVAEKRMYLSPGL